jgi:hexosaminidase
MIERGFFDLFESFVCLRANSLKSSILLSFQPANKSPMTQLLNVCRIAMIATFLALYESADAQQEVAQNLKVEWEVIENSYQGKSQFRSAFTFHNKGTASISMEGWSLYFNFVRAIKPESVTSGATINHINGDLYRLNPGIATIKKGQPLTIEFTSSDWVVNFTDAPAGLYIVLDVDPSNGIPVNDYYVRPSTEPRQYLRFSGDKVGLITPQTIFEQNDSVVSVLPDHTRLIFPTPIQSKLTDQKFTLTRSVIITTVPEFHHEAEFIARELGNLVGKDLVIASKPGGNGKTIVIKTQEGKDESYSLKVSASGIEIGASSSAGIFYGMQSLLTLIDPSYFQKKQNEVIIPGIEVIDEPRFAHRAVFLDVSRNFQTKQQVLKLLDVMALYKLNVLHLHLNDDEGWRIEIPGLPELTDVGSKRGHDVNEEQFLQPSFGSGPDIRNAGSGFYSKSDFIDLLQYAKKHHITVIPEIEMPGHARAAVKSMEVRYKNLLRDGKKDDASKYLLRHPNDESRFRSVQGWNDNIMDPALPSTYEFLETVFDQVIKMYNEAGARLTTIHCGGDEVPHGVWQKSPAVLELMRNDPSIKTTDDLWYYFYARVNGMLKQRKLSLYGWEEIAMRKTLLDGKGLYIPNPDFAGQGTQVDVWNNVLGWGAEDLAYQLANAGYKVVLSCVSHLYFDMAYQKSFDEPGYYWGGFTDVDKPFSFIPYDYFRNSSEDKFGAPLDRSVFAGKERLTDYGKQNIVGIQGLLWAENMINAERMEYMMFPKMLALAERAWAAEPQWSNTKGEEYRKQFKSDYSTFLNTLGRRELRRLDSYQGGYQYRIPMPGVKVIDNRVAANVQFPGLEIRYTTDGKEPTMKSNLYTQAIPAKGVLKFRTFNSKGRGSKVVTIGAGTKLNIE